MVDKKSLLKKEAPISVGVRVPLAVRIWQVLMLNDACVCCARLGVHGGRGVVEVYELAVTEGSKDVGCRRLVAPR